MGFLKKFSQNKIMYFLIVILIVLAGGFSSKPAESEKRAIVTTIGLDKSDIGIELSLSVITPKSASNVNENLFFVSETGKSINEALGKISELMGKFIGLAHCEMIIVSTELMEQDIIKYMDYFIRTNNLTTNSVMFASNGKARDVVEQISKGADPFSQSLFNIIEYNDNFYMPIKMNVENFYKAYYSRQSIALMGVVGVKTKKEIEEQKKSPVLTEKDQQGESDGGNQPQQQQQSAGDINLSSPNSSSSNSSETSSEQNSAESGGSEGGESQESGNSSGESEGGKDEKVLYNQNQMAVIKSGKFVRILTKDEKDFLYLIYRNKDRNFLTIENVDIQEVKNATITVEVYEKKVKKEMYFLNGVPVVNFKLTLYIKLDEINGEEYNEVSLDEITTFLYDNLRTQIDKKIKLMFASVVNNGQINKTDIFAVQTNFYKLHNKEWQKFLNSFEGQRDYLDKIVFQIETRIENKL